MDRLRLAVGIGVRERVVQTHLQSHTYMLGDGRARVSGHLQRAARHQLAEISRDLHKRPLKVRWQRRDRGASIYALRNLAVQLDNQPP
jgi:hypothetical protein